MEYSIEEKLERLQKDFDEQKRTINDYRDRLKRLEVLLSDYTRVRANLHAFTDKFQNYGRPHKQFNIYQQVGEYLIIDIQSSIDSKTQKDKWAYMLRDKNGVHSEWIWEEDFVNMIK